MLGQPFPWVTLCELNPAHSFFGRQRTGDYTKQVEAPLTPVTFLARSPRPAPAVTVATRCLAECARAPAEPGCAGRCPCGAPGCPEPG